MKILKLILGIAALLMVLAIGGFAAYFNRGGDLTQAEMFICPEQMTYSGEESNPEVQIRHKGRLLQPGKDYRTETLNNRDVGFATIRAVGMRKFTGELDGGFEIVPREVSIEWAENIFSYDGQAHTPGHISVTGIAEGDDVKVAVQNSRVMAGRYTFNAYLTGDDAGNYELCEESIACRMEILKAPLLVKAQDVYTQHGYEEVGNGIEWIEGFVNGEDIESSDLSGCLIYSFGETDEAERDAVYEDAVRISGLASRNYSITYIPGDLYIYRTVLPDERHNKGDELLSLMEKPAGTESGPDRIDASEMTDTELVTFIQEMPPEEADKTLECLNDSDYRRYVLATEPEPAPAPTELHIYKLEGTEVKEGTSVAMSRAELEDPQTLSKTMFIIVYEDGSTAYIYATDSRLTRIEDEKSQGTVFTWQDTVGRSVSCFVPYLISA